MAKHKTRSGSPMHITPSFELFRKSKRLVMDNLQLFIPLYLLPFLFLAHSWLWNVGTTHGNQHWYLEAQSKGPGTYSPTLPVYTWGYFAGFLGAFAVISIAVSIIVQIMANKAQLDVAEGKKPTFSELWQTVKELGWRMLGLYLLVGLYILVGLFLLIIPGLIMIRRYYLAPYALLDKRGSIKEAMEYSAKISKPYSGYVWGVIGVGFLVALLNVIPFIGSIAAFVMGLLYSVAPALRYRELKKLST
jgi:hypothetical protein